MFRHVVTASAVLMSAIVASTQVQAITDISEVLTQKNHAQFCKPNSTVDKEKLATVLLGLNGVKQGFDKSNASKELIIRLGDKSGEAETAFKPTARAIQAFLRDGVVRKLDTEVVVYRLQSKRKLEKPTYLDIFAQGTDQLVVLCENQSFKKPEAGALFSFLDSIANSNKSALRLRRDTGTLTTPSSKDNISGLPAANVSFTDNLDTNVTNFNVEAALGYEFDLTQFNTEKSLFRLIPFVEYQRNQTSTIGPTSDLEVLSPGAIFSYLKLGKNLTYSLNGTSRVNFDFAQRSEVYEFEGRFNPAFRFFGIPTGAFSYQGPFRIRPSISFVYGGNYVFESGLNANLIDRDAFYRIGGTAELSVQAPTVPILKDASLNLKYDWQQFFSSPVDNLQRFEASVDYAIAGSDNYNLSLRYVNGRNDLSLQEQNFWQVALGIRF